ncbi:MULTISPECIES: LLM class flavin-dependent oxidoreductase [Mycolicibacterium]|jgi:probable LLM family oxidoreductase|uniref:Oxidoreductase n=2 Tax=Mycolicibacterium TaxID=1866885 RepID=A0A7I9WKW0_9MYCO|nr:MULTISPECIES: LLM class flavin-dependent oxidoreductase [Mycolicibacterium]ANW65857.1 luciferase [Mycobacterium sp. djl-10]MCV7184699.1 LLM class flavin-dependent oxidoreductase [Mycolicibacterium murale]STZ61402.1 putative luciferase-like oxidoreductase [Mycolicibacterium tokaiense]BBY90212.1 oxidoreductase [Mycolicibacterium tokaiense]GFG58293.1 oxidoreductase [Mycolicibacterium murale]
MDVSQIEFGIDSFGDRPRDDRGEVVSHAEAIRAAVREAVLADQVGIDVVALGEHHRPEYAISSPETVLAGIATATTRIRLASGVTVLSSDDPVRVYQRFATVDALSRGRAEVILGRGSFTESFPLFGYDLADYEVLFEEKIELFHRLLDEKPVTWTGTTRAALQDADVFPKTDSGRLNTWVGVGGSPESVVRTARYGFGLMLAIIGGAPERFAPYLELYRHAAQEFGTIARPVGMHSPGFVAATDEEAKELYYPGYREIRDRIGALRGWPPLRRAEFDSEVAGGSLYVGSVETVARKIARAIGVLGVGRFDMIYSSAGTVSASARLRSVELYGTQVIPRVRELLAES